MKTTYRQCELRGRTGEWFVSWIPSEFAVVGKVVRVRMPNDEWRDGLAVVEVHGCKDVKELDDDRKTLKRFEEVLESGARK